MSYPKSHPKPNEDVKTKLEQQRIQRLTKFKERDEVRSVLVASFHKKYGSADFVQREIDSFLKDKPLTEAYLRQLDLKLQEQAGRQAQPTPKRSSVPSARLSPSPRPPETTKRSSLPTSKHEDEWAAMLRYDAQVFRREEKARLQRLQEDKEKLRLELDRQLVEKEKKKRQDQKDQHQYVQALQASLELQNAKELQKEKDKKEKLRLEAVLRDRQLALDKERKKEDARLQLQFDHKLVSRLKQEMSEEQRRAEEKKAAQKAHMKRMFLENEANKRIQEDAKARERQLDVKSMEEFGRMLARQEEERKQEIKAREDRQLQVMARMAGAIINEKHNIRDEDVSISQQFKHKEEIARRQEEQKKLKKEAQRNEMKQYLDKQIEDRETRKRKEKASFNEQAGLWKKDADDYFSLQDQKKRREKKLNALHAQTLQMQIDEKEAIRKKQNMNATEARLNSDILQRIKEDHLTV